jgi:hypothetical protein
MPQYQGVWNLQDAARLQSQQQWVTDPNFRNTTLLLQADNAANGAQNNTFLDSSSNSFAITRFGGNPGMTQGTFSPFNQTSGSWSNYFDGSGDNLTVPAGSAFAYGTQAFTVEAWVFPTASAEQIILSQTVSGTNYFVCGIGSANQPYFIATLSGAGTSIVSPTTVTLNQWNHIAWVREGTGSNQFKIYLNGINVITGTVSIDLANTTYTPTIGQYTHSATLNYTGYISNLRVTKGGALYTSNFNPSTLPFTTTVSVGTVSLLTCQNNRFIDNSTANSGNPWTITVGGNPYVQPFAPFAPQFQYTQSVIGGSGYFDGSGDFLTVPSTSSLAMGTGDFCIEMWIYPTALSGNQTLYANFASGGGNSQIGIFIRNADSIRVSSWDTAFLDSATGTIVGNSWQHIVNCRSGNNSALFINGVRQASTSGTPNNFSSTDAFSIGRRPANDQFFPGYISGLRVVKGSSVYDPTLTTLTIPTAPPTAITNTQLLCNFTNAGIIDGTMDNVLETVGNAQVSTSVVKYGSGSLAFDGSSDSLKIGLTPLLNLGTGDFTIEFWCNPNTVGASRAILASGNTTFNAGAVIIAGGVSGNDSMRLGAFDFGGPSYTIVRDTAATPTGTWTHYAFVRSGNNFALYRNGTSVATATWTGSFNFNTNNLTKVGGDTWDGANSSWDGYIDDFRITRGVARYLSNFTPPQVALPRQ